MIAIRKLGSVSRSVAIFTTFSLKASVTFSMPGTLTRLGITILLVLVPLLRGYAEFARKQNLTQWRSFNCRTPSDVLLTLGPGLLFFSGVSVSRCLSLYT